MELFCLTNESIFVGDLSCSLRRLALNGVFNLLAASTVRGSWSSEMLTSSCGKERQTSAGRTHGWGWFSGCTFRSPAEGSSPCRLRRTPSSAVSGAPGRVGFWKADCADLPSWAGHPGRILTTPRADSWAPDDQRGQSQSTFKGFPLVLFTRRGFCGLTGN